MGMITINTLGSFGTKEVKFSAMKYGHAHAINEAMEWLNREMGKAINSDHALRSKGISPEIGFIKQ